MQPLKVSFCSRCYRHRRSYYDQNSPCGAGFLDDYRSYFRYGSPPILAANEPGILWARLPISVLTMMMKSFPF